MGRSHNIKSLSGIALIIGGLLMLASCNETDNSYNPYENWESRNATWYLQIADSARTAINAAKAQYGDNWETYCEWRMYKSILKSQDSSKTGAVTDSICVHIKNRGTGMESPLFSDSVRINYKGLLMKDSTYVGDGTDRKAWMQETFDASYRGAYNPKTCTPVLLAVDGMIEGFSTALVYMHEGDEWVVYIPQNLGYAETAMDGVPEYSTLEFHVTLVKMYRVGRDYIPAEWK